MRQSLKESGFPVRDTEHFHHSSAHRLIVAGMAYSCSAAFGFGGVSRDRLVDFGTFIPRGGGT